MIEAARREINLLLSFSIIAETFLKAEGLCVYGGAILGGVIRGEELQAGISAVVFCVVVEVNATDFSGIEPFSGRE